MIDISSTNLYDVLDVDPRATVEEIKRAYQIAQRAYGTDHMATYSLFTEEERQEILRRVQGAYTVLIDPDRRREYDEELHRVGAYPGSRTSKEMSIKQPSFPKLHAEDSPQEEDPDERQDRERRIRELLSGVREGGDWSGKVLKEIREIRGQGLETIAQRTKISLRHLRSIEDDSFEYLPPDVYVKGFIVQISKILGLNPEEMAAGLMEHIRKNRGSR